MVRVTYIQEYEKNPNLFFLVPEHTKNRKTTVIELTIGSFVSCYIAIKKWSESDNKKVISVLTGRIFSPTHFFDRFRLVISIMLLFFLHDVQALI